MPCRPLYEGNDTDIAIVGLSVRVPGADTVQQFWEQVKAGHEVVADLSSLDGELCLDCSESGRRFIAGNTNIKDIGSFDALFFDFSSREASLMDPQHRLFLECAWEALEDAGYDPRAYNGLTGLYAGVYANYYSMVNLLPSYRSSEAAAEIQMQIAGEKDHVAMMAAYKLGLTGPVMNVQSACSTSLAAIHLACESLLTYSSDMMVCGAATLSIPQSHGYYYQDNGLLSSDGHLRAFDAGANGTIYSDGAGCVVLKRLRDAWNDGDTIHAVIKGSALNNDGSARVGYTAPGVKGQVQVIERAQLIAGIHPESIGYIEGHGTGTPLGDAIELEALHEVFGKATAKRAFCALGSVKANFGHTGPAAGVIGLIKAVMALKNKVLPPSINVDTPSDRLMRADSPFYLNSLLTEWGNREGLRRAAVSSFGLGGTNVHVILEEAPSMPVTQGSRRWQLLVLSAKSEAALRVQSVRLQEALRGRTENELADAAYTLLSGRRQFRYRGFCLCRQADDFSPEVEDEDHRFVTGYRKDNARSVGFLFPGNCPVEWSMVKGFMEQEPYFVDKLEECLAAAKRQGLYLGGLRELLALRDADSLALAGFTVQYALAQLWLHWGISPNACSGAGTSAVAAACISGMLGLEEALDLCVSFARVITASEEARKQELGAYEALIGRIRYTAPNISFKSPLERPIFFEERKIGQGAGERYRLFWLEHMTQCLKKAEVLHDSAPWDEKDRITLEMSLTPLWQKGPDDEIARSRRPEEAIYHMLGMLWLEGCPVNGEAFYDQEYRRRIGLPTYPFERKLYWIEIEEQERFTPGEKAVQSQALIQLEPEQLKGYVAPRNEDEARLAGHWESFLGITPIGVEDNYYELGGNSLLAVSLHEQICRDFKVEMGLEVFFEQQTIAGLCQAIMACRINSTV